MEQELARRHVRPEKAQSRSTCEGIYTGAEETEIPDVTVARSREHGVAVGWLGDPRPVCVV